MPVLKSLGNDGTSIAPPHSYSKSMTKTESVNIEGKTKDTRLRGAPKDRQLCRVFGRNHNSIFGWQGKKVMHLPHAVIVSQKSRFHSLSRIPAMPPWESACSRSSSLVHFPRKRKICVIESNVSGFEQTAKAVLDRVCLFHSGRSRFLGRLARRQSSA